MWFLTEFFKRGFCAFLSNVVCSFQKYDKPMMLDRCLTCSHYLRFMRGMEEEEEEFFAECDKIRKFGYPKSLRELEADRKKEVRKRVRGY